MTPPASASPVVVGIDGSQAAIDAALWAADEASTRGVSLRLVHVIDVEDEVYRDLDEDPAEIARDWPETEAGRTSLDAAAIAVQNSGSHVTVETQILWGDIGSRLIEESRQAMLMCVGSRGIAPFCHGLLGSTAATLAERAHSPVAIIRTPTAAPSSEPCWIVAVVDDSPSSEAVIAYAIDEAALRRAPVLAVGVSRRGYAGMRFDDLDHRVASWRRDRPHLHIHPVVAATDVAGFLGEHDELSVQLTVIGAADAADTVAIVGPHQHTRRSHHGCSVVVVR